VWVCPVRVQGDGAAQEIAEAIRTLNRLSPSADVMIVGRGGGSVEDLWAFNEEVVAQAIYESRIPVVSAVGHEIDVTIADLVADHRAETPTAAAVLVAPSREELTDGLDGTAGRLRDLLDARLEAAWQRWNDLAERRAFRMPLERVRELERRTDEWGERLGRAGAQRVVRARQALEAAAGRLEGLSPLNVLARGYSLTRTQPGLAVVRDAAQVRPGDRLVTLLGRGRVVSRVEAADPRPWLAGGPDGPPATEGQAAEGPLP
jgi:exodeoxyribonuclease VII large subunit